MYAGRLPPSRVSEQVKPLEVVAAPSAVTQVLLRRLDTPQVVGDDVVIVVVIDAVVVGGWEHVKGVGAVAHHETHHRTDLRGLRNNDRILLKYC